MNQEHPKKKIYATTEYVDIETGEIINKNIFEKEYIKIKSEKQYIHHEKYIEVKWTTIAEKNKQQKLWD